MTRGVVELGVCRNPTCPKGMIGEQIERYPGPGEYCPECGEQLEPVPVPMREAVHPEVYQALEADIFDVLRRHEKSGPKRSIVVAAVVIALLLIAVMVVFHPIGAAVRSVIGARVCSSSGSDATALRIVRCDVRFRTA